MKKVILVGTRHSIQRGNSPDFERYVLSLVENYSPRAIAEEIDQGMVSVANKIADSAEIHYSIIDPTPDERIQLGIPTLNNIENDVFMEFDDYKSIEAQDEVSKRKERVYRAREQEWFRRLDRQSNWPILVICGAAHYLPFADLLREKGIEVVALADDWMP